MQAGLGKGTSMPVAIHQPTPLSTIRRRTAILQAHNEFRSLGVECDPHPRHANTD
jgi:hypothetical protein